MTATQTQFRRGTSAQCEGMTPAEGECVVDLTNDTWRVGDGSRAGGFIMPNFNHIQMQSFQFAVAGGTANAITLTLSPAPLSYSQPLKVKFKASNTNTGETTIDVNGLGTKNIKKISSGSLTNLSAGDIVSGGIYEIAYDGTQFQLLTLTNQGIVSVSQGDLNTSTGTFSGSTGALVIVGTNYYLAGPTAATIVTLPGGQYGFFPLTGQNNASAARMAQWIPSRFNSTTNAATVAAWGTDNSNSGAYTVKGSQRYITSSPPFDMGDGEVGGFAYVIVNNSGDIIGHYSADVPPWGYNGPTDIRCTHKCPVTGKKYRKVMKKLSPKKIMDGAKIEYVLQEITHDIKNADMQLIPHPFENIGSGNHVVMIDPMSDKIRRLIEIQNAGDYETVSEIITGGYLRIDNEFISRKGPKGVNVCAAKFRSK